MGFIRGGLLILAIVLISISLLAGNIFWTMSSSLEYNKVESELVSISENIFNEQLNIDGYIEQLRPQIESFCQMQNSEYTFNYGDQTITLSCDTVLNEPENIAEESVKNLIQTYYYKEYNCNFWNCFSDEVPLFLISQKAHDYWKSKFIFTLTASAILTGVIFLLVKKKTNFPIIIGAVVILSAIPISKISNLASSSIKSLVNLEDYLVRIILIFFSDSQKIFLTMLVIGILILVIGIILKIIKTSFRIMNVFSKFKRKDKGTNKPARQETIKTTPKQTKNTKTK